MKLFSKICLLFFCLKTGGIHAQLVRVNFTTLDQKVSNMVYDSTLSRILITIPATDTTYANSLGMVNPNTTTLSNLYYIGKGAGALALTSDNKYAYVGLDSASYIYQFDLNSRVVVKTIDIGTDTFEGGRKHTASIACMPGNDSIIASANFYGQSNDAFAETVLYKEGERLPDYDWWAHQSNDLHFASSQKLCGFANKSSGFTFSSYKITTSGLNALSYKNNVVNGSYDNFIIAGNMVILDGGEAGYLTDSGIVYAGTFPITWGDIHPYYQNVSVCYDPHLDLVCFGYSGFWSGTDTFYIERFHRSNFQRYDRLFFRTHILEESAKLVWWGDSEKFAMTSVPGKLYIINGKYVATGIKENSAWELKVYPNPAKDKLTIENPFNNKSILSVIDINGREVISKQVEQKNELVDISSLFSGDYIISIRNEKESAVAKIIKQ